MLALVDFELEVVEALDEDAALLELSALDGPPLDEQPASRLMHIAHAAKTTISFFTETSCR